MNESDGILVPVKRLDEAKQRLADRLGPEERVSLGLAMLSDVLEQTWPWSRRFVVTRDPQAGDLASGLGCEIVPEQEAGLNAALSLGTKRAQSDGVGRLLVLPADVPAVTRTDVETLFSSKEQVVVASSLDGGTTAILRSPPDVIETAFGPESAAQHLRAARTAELEARHLRLPSLLLDVDVFSDLERLAAMNIDRRSVKLARKLLGR